MIDTVTVIVIALLLVGQLMQLILIQILQKDMKQVKTRVYGRRKADKLVNYR